MPLRNRVDPWGDLHSVAERGLLTGNRGCLVDDAGKVVRHHRGSLWIVCVTEFRGWQSPLARPGRWTPIFFLDDAVALAAGHRPCGLCRRPAYESYRRAVATGLDAPDPASAQYLNRRLASERLHSGRGVARGQDRRTWTAGIDDLPAGTVLVGPGRQPRLLLSDRLVGFAFSGWANALRRPVGVRVEVLTPPTSVVALANGYEPLIHPSAYSTPCAKNHLEPTA